MDQLDLFNLSPVPSADMIPFPFKRRYGDARSAAAALLERSDDAARQKYWRGKISRMAAQMRKAGVADDQIERELDGFKVLVQRILDAQPADRAHR
jgi:hypothetical protein